MLEAAVGALPAMGIRLLAITMLTSHSAETLAAIGVGGSMADAVRRLALLAREAGVDGVVASPQEIALVREACGADFLIVLCTGRSRHLGIRRRRPVALPQLCSRPPPQPWSPTAHLRERRRRTKSTRGPR